jgi:hypothetical protein
MVLVDTVYQRVLALANKEQRGYITPQEFNLFANQAQLDIFEQYFYDLNQFSRTPGNTMEYSDMISILEEKIGIFKTTESLSYVSNYFELPTIPAPELYRLGTVMYELDNKNKVIEEVDEKELTYMLDSSVLKPVTKRPVYVKRLNRIYIYPTDIIDDVSCSYIKKPAKVIWGYSVIGENALYNSGTSTNFELHDSEETDLVIKILGLAGIELQSPELYQIAGQEDVKNTQQEKQ